MTDNVTQPCGGDKIIEGELRGRLRAVALFFAGVGCFSLGEAWHLSPFLPVTFTDQWTHVVAADGVSACQRQPQR